MSFHSYHTYGYGIETTTMIDFEIGRIRNLIHLAPQYEQAITKWFEENGISDPTYDDYLEYGDYGYIGIASLMAEVIQEAEGICFTACDDFEGRNFLLYEPSYPWDMTEKDLWMTTEKIRSILARYFIIITDETITVDFYEPENGG